MSYLVLARKYRPRTFAEVAGQPHVARTLENALRLDRVAHAYLFAGPRGVGKTSMARILARSLLCERGASTEPCGECERCRAILQGQDLDVVEIDAASNRGIDDIRQLRDKARVAPMRGDQKFYIVDEVHQLTSEAFNALLKILEEPPAHVRFVLCTTEPEKIPDTIRSRCQCFEFRRVPEGEIAARLADICGREGIECEDGALKTLARLARGGMRDAQSLLDQAITHGGGRVTRSSVEEVTGVLSTETVLPLVRAAVGGDARGTLVALARLDERGTAPEALLDALTGVFRDLLVLVAGGGAVEVADAALLAELSGSLDEERALGSLSLLLAARRRLRDHDDPRLPLEATLLRIARLGGVLSLGEVLDRFASGGGSPPKGRSERASRRPPAAQSPRTPVGADLDLDDPVGLWRAITARVAASQPATAAFLETFEGVRREGDRLWIRRVVRTRSIYDLKHERVRRSLSVASRELLGRDLLVEESPGAADGEDDAGRSDRFLDRAREMFDGEEV